MKMVMSYGQFVTMTTLDSGLRKEEEEVKEEKPFVTDKLNEQFIL